MRSSNDLNGRDTTTGRPWSASQRYVGTTTHWVTPWHHRPRRLETLIARCRELFHQQVYLLIAAIATVPGALIQPVFGWKAIDSFSAQDEERQRPEGALYTP